MEQKCFQIHILGDTCTQGHDFPVHLMFNIGQEREGVLPDQPIIACWEESHHICSSHHKYWNYNHCKCKAYGEKMSENSDI